MPNTNPLRGEEFLSPDGAQGLVNEMKELLPLLEYEVIAHEDRPLPPEKIVGPQPLVRQEVGPNKVVIGHILNDHVKRTAKQYSITDETTMQAMQVCFNGGVEFENNRTKASEDDWRKQLLEDDEEEDDNGGTGSPKEPKALKEAKKELVKKVIPPLKSKKGNTKKRSHKQAPMYNKGGGK